MPIHRAISVHNQLVQSTSLHVTALFRHRQSPGARDPQIIVQSQGPFAPHADSTSIFGELVCWGSRSPPTISNREEKMMGPKPPGVPSSAVKGTVIHRPGLRSSAELGWHPVDKLSNSYSGRFVVFIA